MSRIVIRALLAVVLAAPLLSRPAEARRSHLHMIKCNIDGTYTCGGACNGNWCCSIEY
jgi:hypothetical protein